MPPLTQVLATGHKIELAGMNLEIRPLTFGALGLASAWCAEHARDSVEGKAKTLRSLAGSVGEQAVEAEILTMFKAFSAALQAGQYDFDAPKGQALLSTLEGRVYLMWLSVRESAVAGGIDFTQFRDKLIAQASELAKGERAAKDANGWAEPGEVKAGESTAPNGSGFSAPPSPLDSAPTTSPD